jgi:hypothetical protein
VKTLLHLVFLPGQILRVFFGVKRLLCLLGIIAAFGGILGPEKSLRLAGDALRRISEEIQAYADKKAGGASR